MTDENDSRTVHVAVADQKQKVQKHQQHIILFYKYHPLSDENDITDVYRNTLQKLCQDLSLKGRILVAFEGINGTLAGDLQDVRTFTQALLGEGKSDAQESGAGSDIKRVDEGRMNILNNFWKESKDFFASIGKPALEMNSDEDFKWSRATSSTPLFPDLNIKLVKELIGTGGVLTNIPLEETAKGYLTPSQWQDELTKLSNPDENDAILIDCRNTKECEIGHFEGAIDPQTTTFAQFPKWVEEHRHLLENKRVLMYCTGGIRCEKASAFVRRQVPSVENVQHLKGGIHKYLEAFDNAGDSKWKGRNFVFHADVETKLGCDDGGADETEKAKKPADHQTIVGKCIYCQAPYDNFDPHCVCTVCREPTLSCPTCQQQVSEFHCKQHIHLKSCYFTDLSIFKAEQLTKQLEELETVLIEFAVGKRYKQKRKTLHKQCDKIRKRLAELNGGIDSTLVGGGTQRCRNCEDPDCSGRCWGFYGLKRKEILQKKQRTKHAASIDGQLESKKAIPERNGKKRSAKDANRERVVKELEHLKLSLPPSSYRDQVTGVRVPPPCTRVLKTKMKGKWRGQSVLQVVKDEFAELAKPGVLDRVLEKGLLHVNGNPVSMETAGICLKTGDTISRIVHWHEPPVLVPERIDVKRVRLPDSVMIEFGVPDDTDDIDVYVCNKPSSIPVHGAGPFLSNSLTMMVEAQEKLAPQSLFPCHRTDRVTSGLTICCTNSNIARIIQRSMCEHQVQKLYLARVHGKFISSSNDLCSLVLEAPVEALCTVTFSNATKCIRVDAPIETTDPANGIRQVTDKGKSSISLFQLVSYDSVLDVSLLACRPITGRSHQLRVHLQLLGFPIVNDVLYGGKVLNTSSRTEAAIEALLQSTTKQEHELKGQSLTDADAAAARAACSLCSSLDKEDLAMAAKNYFTPAQLLESGHAIDLHAFQYRIEVPPKEGKGELPNDTTTSDQRPVGVLELRVDNPEWADKAATDHLCWLEEEPN